MRLRREGDSVEVLATALRGLGVVISAEALRLWLNRQLGHKPTRRRKARVTFDGRAAQLNMLGAAQPGPTAVVNDAAPFKAPPLPEAPTSSPDRPSSLILPGETPLAAFHRRLAVLSTAPAKGSDTN